ncbi:hypothetical protein KA005_80080 [bacterium]|nr:hypothetical protein [bacterium]
MDHVQSKRTRAIIHLSDTEYITLSNNENPPPLTKLNCFPVGLWNNQNGFIPGHIEIHYDWIEFIPQTNTLMSAFTIPLNNIVTLAYRNNMVLPFLQPSITLIRQQGSFVQITHERLKEKYHTLIFKINTQGYLFYKAIKIQMIVHQLSSIDSYSVSYY